jgi:hypothetical protein
MKIVFAAMSGSKPTKAESGTLQYAPVDGYLSYAIAVNMEVRGTLGNEDSIVVESSAPAVAKRARAVPVGLLALDRHEHLNVLAHLQPTWVQWGGGGGGGRRVPKDWSSSLETRDNPQPTPLLATFSSWENF